MNSDAQEAALGLLGLSPTNLTPTSTIFLSPTSTIPTKRKQRDEVDYAGEVIDCICGFEVDDGFSIACDVCSRWCHSACFDVAPEEIPDKFKCWTCKPRPASFKERAVRMQKERLEVGGVTIVDKQRSRASPGVERKHRRVSVDKRKRRPSMVNEDVDVDEPWSQSYVHISQDIISDHETRVKLRRQAQHWRGMTALVDSSPLVKKLPSAAFSSYPNPRILPPAYSLHTSTPITSHRLITDYKSSITPSSSYLSDPLNAYAHLGMPKPFVHLFGPPLDVALDSRLTGNHARFARSGCRPNAVLRPLLCDDSNSLGFGVFALRDLKVHEEVVLGWEWDDGNAVHNLPALLKTPHIFPPRQVQHLRHQMSNILHALSSTFTTCACGARAQDCAINRMAAFVDGAPTQTGQQEQHVDLGPLIGRKRGFKTRERIPFSGGMGGMIMCRDDETSPRQSLPAFALPSSPSILHGRSAKGKERAIDGVRDTEMADGRDKSAGCICRAKNSQAADSDPYELPQTLHSPNRLKSHSTFDLRPSDPGSACQHVSYDQTQPENEDNMPPKMRKRWMHRESEALRELIGNTSPSSSQDSNHNHIVRLSQSPGSSSNSAVSLGSPIIPLSRLMHRPGLGITCNKGYGHDRPQHENERQEDHEHHCYHHYRRYHREDDVLTSTHPHHPAIMPPKPASFDSTTISSPKTSLNAIQHDVSSLIAPSISPLTSFANLSLLSPAILGSMRPPPSCSSFPLPPPPNSGPVPTTTVALMPPTDHATAWSPLRRYTSSASSSFTSPPPSRAAPVSSYNSDNGSIASSSSSPTSPANEVDNRPMEYSSCMPSPPLSPSSFQPETLLVDTNNEIQSALHSPDPMWRADSPSGDHVHNHNGPSESRLMNEEDHWESPVVDANRGDRTDLGISSSYSPSLSHVSCALAGKETITAVDSSDRDEEEDHTSLGRPINSTSPSRLESSLLDEVPSYKCLSTSIPQPLPSDPTELIPQCNPAAEYEQVVKEEESRLESSREQPSHLPAPKIKMSLRDFALRKKKQREEQETTKGIQETSSPGGVDFPCIRSESAHANEKPMDQVEGNVDEASSIGQNGIVEVGLKKLKLGKNLVRRQLSCQSASSLPQTMDIVGVPRQPFTTNGYHWRQRPSVTPLTSSSGLVASSIQAGMTTSTIRTKQEVIEQPIPAPNTALQPIDMDTTCYASMYNDSRSISPINPDPHHFQPSSPPRLCQEDGEIGEIMDTPPPSLSSPLPASSLSTSSLPAAPAVNRPSRSISPLSRGSIIKHPDFPFTRSISSSSSQARHPPPTHPRSFKACSPYRPIQQPPPVSTPPLTARGAGVPPTAPRALRQSMLTNRPSPTTPTAMTSSSSYFSSTNSGTTSTITPALSTSITTATTSGRFPPHIPRGPSAYRRWEIDQMQYARPLLRRDSKEGGHAWGAR